MNKIKFPPLDDGNVFGITIWHYGVFKGRSWYYEPACVRYRSELGFTVNKHGLTINRGDVNCSDCKRMMGMEI